MKVSLSALLFSVILFPAATFAAPLTYKVDAIFISDGVLELYEPNGDVCFRSDPSCYPSAYRHQSDGTSDRGGYWSHLAYGDMITATFAFDPFDGSASTDCDIAGWSDCGDFLGLDNYDPANHLFEATWFRSGPTSTVVANLFGQSIEYEGEAGSYSSFGCSLAAPAHAGLPAGYCDFFGYAAEFQVVKYSLLGLSTVPLPASLPFSLAVFLGFGFWHFRAKKRKPKQV